MRRKIGFIRTEKSKTWNRIGLSSRSSRNQSTSSFCWRCSFAACSRLLSSTSFLCIFKEWPDSTLNSTSTLKTYKRGTTLVPLKKTAQTCQHPTMSTTWNIFMTTKQFGPQKQLTSQKTWKRLSTLWLCSFFVLYKRLYSTYTLFLVWAKFQISKSNLCLNLSCSESG